jgi:tetratricopeptide (TPR) repeat protein
MTKFAMAWSDRGFAHGELGQWDRAIADCSKAIELDSNYAKAWSYRGIAHARLKKWDEATADTARAFNLQPDNPWLQNNLAWILSTHPEAAKCDPRRAVELAEKAVKANPKQGTWWTTLGMARYRDGNAAGAVGALQEALRCFEEVGDFEPRVGRSLFFVAMAQQKAGHGPEARQAYDRALAWLQANQQALEKNAWASEEMRRFQAEAEEVLSIKKTK